ncbi:MAG: DRTGG domain-containing protein [Eubacteriales bacterium]
MKIKEIKDMLNAKIYTGEEWYEKEIEGVFASDLMSDVLTTEFFEDKSILVSGLNNPQVIRTAEMLDIDAVILIRGKIPTEETIAMAKDNDMVLMSTNNNMYNVCGILHSKGIKGLSNEKNKDL